MLGIKIGWVCDLDRAWELCLPRYSFTRLDSLARTPAPGYNFRYGQDMHSTGVCTAWHGSCPLVSMSPCPCRHARYYRWPDGSERRTLIKAFGIRFDVLVYGSVRVGPGLGGWQGGQGLWPTRALLPQAGKFGIVPTLINTVAAFTSIGVVSCGRSQPRSGDISPGKRGKSHGHGARGHSTAAG